METSDYQHFLAAIYTDASLRRDFLAAPEKVAKRFDISAETARILKEKHSEAINFFATSLIRKRFNILRSFLPRSFQMIEENALWQFFEQYCEQYTLSKRDRYAHEARQFTAFLLKHSQLSAWKKNLVKLERSQILLDNFFYARVFLSPFNWQELQTNTSLPKKIRPSKLFILIKLGQFRWQRFF